MGKNHLPDEQIAQTMFNPSKTLGLLQAHLQHTKHTCTMQLDTETMSDRQPTRWQHNRIYPHPISPCVYTYDSRLYCCENVDAHCSNIIKP